MSWQDQEVRELKENKYILIDDEPCKIVEITTSKPGKHGEAKARIVAIGIFDNQKRSVVYPTKHKVKVPIIEKKTAQILSISQNEGLFMDMETFEQFNIPIPEEFKDRAKSGVEVEYWESMGKRKLMRV
ncbi:MAG: translation initiation factor IF-5A [Candidatus Thermoplasmatota archaeon]|jgi:translation initiation factor 5A|nr:translation initiation factor IF-5A [Candidatus Thermoplasmatota archaeon]MCL5789347.1 translation initiation factor IF-5A [Candidatus Thermoplasmatota archaeon]